MILKYFAIILLVLSNYAHAYAYDFKLTKSESAWLDAHPMLKVGLMVNTPPRSVVLRGGELEGVDPEVIKLLNERLSGRLKVVTGTWAEIYNDATEKKIDALMSLTPSEERRKYFNYTRPYMSDPHVIVARESGLHFGNLVTLEGHTVAQVRDSFLATYLRKHYPKIKVAAYESALAALHAVQNKKADAYVGSKVLAQGLIEQHDINDLDFHGESEETSETNVIAVRKDWPELVALLDRALASIPAEKLMSATNRWGMASTAEVAAKEIQLSDEEVIWIQKHPEIIVAGDSQWPPYDYTYNGKEVGFSIDYLRLLAKKLGLKLKFKLGHTWAQVIDKAKKNEVDVIPAIFRNEERERFLSFTNPYLSNTFSLIVHSDSRNIGSLEDMRGRNLALVNGYTINKAIIDYFPDIHYTYYDTALEALVGVNEGHVDGYVDYFAVANYLRREHLIENLRAASTDVLPIDTPLYFGVRKDWPILSGILAKAMATVTPEEIDELKKQWLFMEEMGKSGFYLTTEEQKWLKSLGTLRMGIDGTWTPIKFADELGTHLGISSEYTQIIQNKLGLEMDTTVAPWSEIISMARSGDLDILPALNDTEKRREFLGFTDHFVRIPMVIATNTDAPFYTRVDKLTGMVVGVGEGYAIQEKLRQDHPEIVTKGYSSIEESILALDSGELGALVANSAVFTYYKNKLGLKNSLHINNTTPYEDTLAFGVRPKLAPLIPLINRAISTISPEEHKLIMDKWTNIQVHKTADWELIWKIIGACLVLILWVMFWNRKMSREIVLRKKAEVERKRFELDRDRHLSLSKDLIAIAGMDGFFKYVSPSWETTLGYTVDELQSRPFFDFIHPDDHQKSDDEIASLSSGNDTLNFKNRYMHKNGSIRVISWSATPVVSEGVMYCTGRDMTEQNHKQDALEKSEARFRDVAETMGDWIWEVNADGVYTYASNKVFETLGFAPKEIIGKTPFDLMPSDEAQRVGLIFNKIVKARESFLDLENWNLTKAGRLVCLSSSGTPIFDKDGELLGYRGVDHDITDQKKAQQESEKLKAQLFQSQKMEAVGQLAGGIAHDFNNILAAILGFSELVKDRTEKGSEDEENIDHVIKAAQRATKLVSQILSFSRKAEGSRESVEVHRILGEAAQLLRQTIPTTIDISTEIGNGRYTVLADPSQLHQIVMNLGTNAYHALKNDGGQIRLSLREIDAGLGLCQTVPGLARDTYVRLTVEDNGEGMDQRTKEKIFEPFYTTKPQGEGTGMGMSVVHGIVKSYEGAIDIDSHLGHGTRIDIYLPRHQGGGETVETSASELPKGSERILVVDDEPLVAEVTKKLLQKHGYMAYSITSSNEALDLFTADPEAFDMVVTDQAMPGMSGAVLTENMLKLRPELPVILCTGYSEHLNEKMAKEIGVKAFLKKPLDKGLLLKAIRASLDKTA